MDLAELNYYYTKFKYGEDISHALMPKRVREVLLVSTFYDAFVFEQDGRLSDQVAGEFHSLNLNSAPRITSVPTGADALRVLREREFDLVITMMRIGPVTPFMLSEAIKEMHPGLPVLLLLNVRSDIATVSRHPDRLRNIDQVFFWNGDSKLFLAMIKFIEDLYNVEHDTRVGLVRVVLVVEDSVSFYSRYLPELYREIMLQVQLLISEELSDTQKKFRMRTRPKVLLACNYEEAMELANKYEDYLLSVIADVSFPKNGRMDDEAGLDLIRHLKKKMPHVPVAMQSGHRMLAATAKEFDIAFLDKSSESLNDDLRDFIYSNLGFGEFVFRNHQGEVVAVADSMKQFEARLRDVCDDSLLYHAERNHFSAWLIAHGAIRVAKEVRPGRPSDYGSVEGLRRYLINVFQEVRKQRNKGRIVEFEPNNLENDYEIMRMCEGSLGGKGRGIAFLNALLATMEFRERFPGVHIRIPQTVLIGTGEYDWFIKRHDLRRQLAAPEADDQSVQRGFLSHPLSPRLRDKLSAYLDTVKHPIAVRSSGLLEDSQSQPFAGVYQSFMLPNNHPDKAVRVRQLENAVRLVYASTWSRDAKAYVRRTNNRIGDEKMAVLIMEVVGQQFGEYFYPHISGVAQSYNYYPTAYTKHEDGVAVLALGMGQWIVAGHPALRFCPRYPRLRQVPDEALVEHSQTHFYAIDLRNNDFDLTRGETATLVQLGLEEAESHGVLNHLASSWDGRDMRLRDGLWGDGPRLLTFADVLVYKHIPLAEILSELLDIGQRAFGVPVEIEFAVDLTDQSPSGLPPRFYMLQIRPLSVETEALLTELPAFKKEELFLMTRNGMGNGVLTDIQDVIFIPPSRWDKLRTIEMLDEIRKLNDSFPDDAQYLLIGPGRWGSRDRFLGVPVKWADIDRARVIVEACLDSFSVDGSQGTHFFHNLVAMNGGYFTVPCDGGKSFIDWKWLLEQPRISETEFFVHVRTDVPCVIAMNGHDGTAQVYKEFDIERLRLG